MSANSTMGTRKKVWNIAALLSLPILAAISDVPAQAAPVNATITGEIQKITLNNPADHWSGGTMVVGGQTVIIPRNLLIDLPANRLTLKELYDQAPASCLAAVPPETGLAKGDTCNTTGAGGIATIAANRTNGGNTIAGDVFLQKGIEAISGVVTYIDYDEGSFRLNGNQADPTTGIKVRLNDPTARHSIQSGADCVAGNPNCSPDPRFTLDPDNYTNTFSTGYPLCIPSRTPRAFPGLPAQTGSPAVAAATAQALADGSGDVLCPTTNRTVNLGQPVDDSRRMAPMLLGDSITVEGNFENVNGVRFLSAHTSMVSKALSTKNIVSQPDYLFLDEVEIDMAGFQNQRARTLIIGYATLAPADILFYTVHYDPANNAKHEFPWATTTGCDTAAGAGTCTAQGLVGAGANIFRVRYDVDFGVGAKARLNPCAHLRADARMGSNICPTNLSTEAGNLGEQFAVMSPIPREVQARTGHGRAAAAAGVALVTLDVSGSDATNSQYLFPFGIGLGGVAVIEFNEIDLDKLNTPFSFTGLPWAMDRRLSPGGCDGACETSPQPLDPFPFEGLAMDPRLQAPPIGGLSTGLPSGPYSDTNFTATTLSNVRDRMLSYVDAGLGKFNGNGTVLQWPPIDPAAQIILPTPNVNLICTGSVGPNTPPVALNDGPVNALSATAVTIAVLSNDSDADNDVLTVTAVSAVTPVGAGTAVINVADNTITFTPAVGFSGSASFTYDIADGNGGTASASVTVSVGNAAPIANPDSASVAAGSTVIIPVLSNDTDANGDILTVTGVTSVVGGTAINNGNSVSFTAGAASTGGSFNYSIADGNGGTAGSSVTIAVTPPENLAVVLSQFRTGTAEWRVSGTSSDANATVTVRFGGINGPIIGSSQVLAGAWAVRVAGSAIIPNAASTISIVSTGGATQTGIPVGIRR